MMLLYQNRPLNGSTVAGSTWVRVLPGAPSMDLSRIKNSVTVSTTGCWLWNKSCSSSGYGQLTINYKYWNSHVYAYVCVNGPIGANKVVRHMCHNRKCCNPDHLCIGTQKDNYKDSIVSHTRASRALRKRWIVNGVTYATCREAVKETGICMNSIIKYTVNGVFNVEAYYKGCQACHAKAKI